MRPAETYRGARRNAWHQARKSLGRCWFRWEQYGDRFDTKVYTPKAAPVRPNRSRHLEGWPTLRELAKRKVAA